MEKNKSDSSILTQHVAVYVKDDTPSYSTANPHLPPAIHPFDNLCILTHIYTWTLVAAAINGLIKILIQDKKQSHVDVDGLFLRITFVTLDVAGLAHPLSGAINYLQIATNEINNTLLKMAFCFSVILAPL